MKIISHVVIGEYPPPRSTLHLLGTTGAKPSTDEKTQFVVNLDDLRTEDNACHSVREPRGFE